MSPNDIDILLAKYFGGEASADELTALDNWLAQSDENQLYFDEITVLFEKMSGVIPTREPDTAKALAKFEQYMQQHNTVVHDIKPAPHRRKTISLLLRIAAVLVIVVGLSAVIYTYTANNGLGDTIKVVASASPLQYVMPDSSMVTLSENSEISYNRDNKSGEMKISLKGKAAFDVSPQSSGKVIVSAGGTFIKDIGTIFTVEAYTNSTDILVTVQNGKVLFYTEDNKGVDLEEGEVGLFNKNTKLFDKRAVSTDINNPLIVFDATPLYEVVQTLQQKYNVVIKIADVVVANRQITVMFDENDNINDILQIIAETLTIKVHKANGVYVLSAH